MSSANRPIFIAAPVRRSGTTLLQRLCCGSGEALVFGESAANDLVQAGMMFDYKRQFVSYNAGRRDELLAEVREGKVNQWIPDILPEIEEYLAIHAEALNTLCSGFAKTAKCPRWGVKLPEWPVASLAFWQHHLPESRTIYIIRDVQECVRSAQAAGMILDADHESQFRQAYENNVALARKDLLPGQTYFLDYANLTGSSADVELDQIAKFLGLTSLPASVLAVRVGDY